MSKSLVALKIRSLTNSDDRAAEMLGVNGQTSAMLPCWNADSPRANSKPAFATKCSSTPAALVEAILRPTATGEPGGTDRMIALWRWQRHNGAMPSVQIKDVPEHTHAVLRQRAAAAHQSLQEYLRTKLIQEASAPTVEEVLDRAGGRTGGRVPIKTATEILREDRDRR